VADLAQGLYEICMVLSEGRLTAREVASRFGTISQADGDVDFSMSGWKKAHIAIQSKNDLPSVLTLAPEEPFPVSALTARFGPPIRRVLLNPYAHPRWRFEFRPAESPLYCSISADVPESEEMVLNVIIVPQMKI